MIIIRPRVIMVKGYLLLNNKCTTHQMQAYKTRAYNKINERDINQNWAFKYQSKNRAFLYWLNFQVEEGKWIKAYKNLFFSAALTLLLALRMKLILLYVPKITHRLNNNLVLLCFCDNPICYINVLWQIWDTGTWYQWLGYSSHIYILRLSTKLKFEKWVVM